MSDKLSVLSNRFVFKLYILEIE